VSGVLSDRKRLLDAALVVGILDGLLLLVLIYVAFIDRSDNAVHVIGPIHGIGFLGLVFLTVRGVGEGFWGWWYPAIVVVTGGPLGTLAGELKLRGDDA
jgi:hypothetical protein